MNRSYDKPSLTWQQQLEHLKTCGLIVHDDNRALYWLQHVSYYRLSAYWLYFEHPKGQPGPRFKHGTTFDQVTALYDFDRGLRRLVMRGTEHVEVALRGSWAYQLGQLGEGHAYLNAALYHDRESFHTILAKLVTEVGWSKETYIKHYRDSYDTPALPPVWMIAEMMSFGQLSKWYSNLKDRALRNKISRPLGLEETVMVPLIKTVTSIRNICAHHGRLWNRGFLAPPKLAQKPENLHSSLNHNAANAGTKLYNALTMVAHVVSEVAPNSTWRADLAEHIRTHPEGDFAAMGFPEDWEIRPIWAHA